ncbi:MAG: aminotransferase class I/II-fold pyridoxal phosphate-dependent enzyme [Bacteroidales bacterium]
MGILPWPLSSTTNFTISPKKREQLLSICERHNIILGEDSIEEELKYFGMAHLPIKSKDENNRVIYLGSFSKILSPGLRLGWIIADSQCISRLNV